MDMTLVFTLVYFRGNLFQDDKEWEHAVCPEIIVRLHTSILIKI